MSELRFRIERNKAMKLAHGSSYAKRWQRRMLWEMNPHCRFCGVLTVLPEQHPSSKPNPVWATIEHLDSRLSPDRGKRPGEFRHTLSCWRCNNQRNYQEHATTPRQTLWERSGHLYWIGKESGALNEVDGLRRGRFGKGKKDHPGAPLAEIRTI